MLTAGGSGRGCSAAWPAGGLPGAACSQTESCALSNTDAAFAYLLSERTAVLLRVPLYRPGRFCLREFLPLRAVLGAGTAWGLLVAGAITACDLARCPGLVRVCALQGPASR